MNKKTLLLMMTIALTLLLVSFQASAQSGVGSVFATGLRAPIKIIQTPKGNLLIAESGNGPNTGRLSILDLSGNRRTLIDGLPSGAAPPNNAILGPSGLAMRGRTLFITIGAGDGTLNGPAGSEIPNPNPSSRFLSSVLSLRLSPQAEETTQGFTMTAADQTALLNQGFLRLTDAAGNDLIIEVVTNFPNFTTNFRPDVPDSVRPSNPFGLVIRGDSLFVVDAAQNKIYEVDPDTGSTQTFVTFPSRQNPTPVGPPVIDAVPNSIRLIGKSLLVSFLTGFPFPAGTADVRKIRLVNGANEPFIGGLSSAIDILPSTNASGQLIFYTLEFSTNMLVPNTPGRLTRFDETGSNPVVLLSTLATPTSMAEVGGSLYITEIFAGRVSRVQIP